MKKYSLPIIMLKKFDYDLSVCKVISAKNLDFDRDFFFLGRTDEETSLVCKTCDVPANTLKRDDGWKAFRIQGELDFSLIGILSKISTILAENKIGIFAISTYNTDYILVRAESFDKALNGLKSKGYEIEE